MISQKSPNNFYAKAKDVFNRVQMIRWGLTRRFFELRVDRRLGIDTCGKADINWNLSSNRDAVGYAATRYKELQKIIHYLKLTPQDVFVDFGCGKGRVVFFISTQGVKKVVGLELDPVLMNNARKNLQTMKVKHSPIELIEGDAINYDLKEATVLFFYNPFGSKTLQTIVDHLKKSLNVHPRQIRILYKNAIERVVLDNTSWLKMEGPIEDSEIFVWRN